MPAPLPSKRKLRYLMRTQLSEESSLSSLAQESRQTCEQLASYINEWHAETEIIAIYHALPDEVDLRALHHIFPNKSFAYPLLKEDNTLQFHLVSDPTTMIQGSHGIMEPRPQLHPALLLEQIELYLLPGLAFDKDNGNRLGKGLGCYDRTLANLDRRKSSLIGIARPLQLQSLPAPESHDILLSHLATPESIIQI